MGYKVECGDYAIYKNGVGWYNDNSPVTNVYIGNNEVNIDDIDGFLAEYIKETFGGLSKEEILEAVKEKYPENFI